MSKSDSKSLKKVTIKSTTTHQCHNYKTVKTNSHLTSPSIQNYTTYDNFINITYKADVPSIDNEWEEYARKYGE